MKLEKETDIEQAGRDYLAQLLTSDKEKSPEMVAAIAKLYHEVVNF
ncbi:hypothetical protein [Liquorilactobacillus satsumensis]|nr:hypothetical protein [Liquorilactobacillus satsumensis]